MSTFSCTLCKLKLFNLCSISEKLAKQIILDLKGKLEVNNNSNKDYTELLETLKSLGYKAADIKRILPKINDKSSIEEQVKEALRLLLK